jgi:cobalt/nickel transport protein
LGRREGVVKSITKFWLGIAVLAILSPLGLILPAYFKAGSAWGEWGADEIQKLVGYLPRGLEKLSSLWSAPFPDFAYIISAVAGIFVTLAVVFLIGRALAKKSE